MASFLSSPVASALLAPLAYCAVHSLPVELLITIFELVYYSYRTTVADRRYPYLLEEICVCTRWKTVIEGHPLFWQLIVSSPSNERLRQRALQFSGTHLLSFIASSKGDAVRYSTTLLQTVLDTDVLNRIESVELEHLTPTVEFAPVNATVSTVYPLAIQFLTGPEDAPTIHDIRIVIRLDFNNATGRPMQNLRSLHLEGLGRPPDIGKWSRTLQTLALVRVTDLKMESLLGALETASRLLTLEIVMTPLGADNIPIRRKQSVHLPALERIQFYTDLPDIIALLHYIATPALGHLLVFVYTTPSLVPRDAHDLPASLTDPHFDDIAEAAVAVIRRHACNHLDIGRDLQVQRVDDRQVVPLRRGDTVFTFCMGEEVSYSYTQRVALQLLRDTFLAGSMTSMRLHVSHRGSVSDAWWRRALRAAFEVNSLEISGTSKEATPIFLALSQPDLILPSLESVLFIASRIDVPGALAIAALIRQRVIQSVGVPALNDFTVRTNGPPLETLRGDEHRILTDSSLPIAVKLLSRTSHSTSTDQS